jgi:ABC-2 type transport system ATP-binding protein
MDETFCIEATGLTKRFGDITAVDGLTLRIRPGEIYGFLGLNGAGKTTTIRMLLGMIRPSAGTVSLFGTRIRPGEQSIWRRVGYLVETPHAYPELTVRENLEIIRRWRGLNSSLVVDKIIGDLKLTPYAGRRAGKLSLGNAQRLGLAKALIHHPDLLILDEPANALDPAGIVEIRELLRDLAARDGVAVFISSHILNEIARLATRIGVVHEGRLVKELNAAELLEQEDRRLTADVRDVTAGLKALARAGITASQDGNNTLITSDRQAMRHPENIATLLVEAGSPPMRLVVERGDLESYFIKLVGLEKGNSDEQRR